MNFGAQPHKEPTNVNWFVFILISVIVSLIAN